MVYTYTKHYNSYEPSMQDYMRDIDYQQLADITYAKKTFGKDCFTWSWSRRVEDNSYMIHWDFNNLEDIVQFKLARG